MRVGVSKGLRVGLWCALTFSLSIASTSLGAQGIAQSLGTDTSDPLSQEVLRALQQQRGGQVADPQLQPNVLIQNPPVYPQALPAMSPNPQQNLLPATNNTGLSALERLMSLRVGQRILQFGYDVFGHGDPVMVHQSGALQDSYVLGEGDEIVVTLHGQQNANFRTRVDRDGRVLLPGLSPISASGRSFGAFRSDLEAAVGHAFVGTDVLVSVGAVRQISVRVVGEVNTPGIYSLTGLSTALDALSLAEGVKKTGSLRDIQIVRGNKSLHLDLYALLTDRAVKSDITLTEGDRIIVPLLTKTVAVVGQVKRPAIYELAPGEIGARATDLLALAGGPEVRGAYRLSVLKTRDDGRREMMQVKPQSNTLVRDGDALFVASSLDVSLAKVEMMGSAASHSYFALDSAPTLHALLKSADMLAPKPGQPLPYLLISAIIRLDPQTMQRSIIPFSPLDAISGKSDTPLQSNDVVYILNVPEMRYIARRAAAAQNPQSADEGSGTNMRQSNMRSSPYGRDSNGQPVSAGALQAGSLSGMAALQSGRAGMGADDSGIRPFVELPEYPPSSAQNPRNGESDTRSYFPANAANTGQSGYGTLDTDGLPELNGIPAPPQTLAPSDATTQGDVSMSGDTGAERNPDDAEKDAVNAYDQRIPGRSNAARRTTLRLFVGLDDDQRQLLVNTLSNYYVLVSGEVNNPGAFLAMPQVGLDRIVQAAGGVTPNVDLSSFEISSAEVDNQSGSSHTVRKTYKLTADQFAQVMLNPMDRIRFNKVFSDNAGEASIFGEVRYPGTYGITRGEHLSSVLARAGGLTQAAYAYGAIFLRRSVAEQERGVLQREADTLEGQLVGLMGSVAATKGQISDSEILYINQMTDRLRRAEGQGGRVAVQIDPKEIAAHPELDVTLEPGDQLFIPRKPNSVVVAGEVMSPSGIQYESDMSVADYIARAGGTNEIADDDHIFVIQPDGSALQAEDDSWWRRAPQLAPGSVIVVPRTLRPFTWDTLLENVIQVTSQLAITAASISVIAHN